MARSGFSTRVMQTDWNTCQTRNGQLPSVTTLTSVSCVSFLESDDEPGNEKQVDRQEEMNEVGGTSGVGYTV